MAQHLANNHFDVLVVDLHALQTVDVLHFVDDVTCSASIPSRRRISCGSDGPSLQLGQVDVRTEQLVVAPLWKDGASRENAGLIGNNVHSLKPLYMRHLYARSLE
jgi:hypothetical protein